MKLDFNESCFLFSIVVSVLAVIIVFDSHVTNLFFDKTEIQCLETSIVVDILEIEHRRGTVLLENGQEKVISQPQQSVKNGSEVCAKLEPVIVKKSKF